MDKPEVQRGFSFNASFATLVIHRFIERFVYYGGRSMLVVFMIRGTEMGGLGLPQEDAFWIYGLLSGIVYYGALPAGFIGDHLLHSRYTMWLGGFLNAFGLLALATGMQGLVMVAAILIGVGTSLYMTNHNVGIVRSMDDQPYTMEVGFLILYIVINLGALTSTMAIPSLRHLGMLSYQQIFLGLGILMLLAQVGLIVLNSAMRPVPGRSNLQESALSPSGKSSISASFIILGLIVVSSLFWIAYEFTYSAFYNQVIAVMETPVSQALLQFVNPVVLFILIPALIAVKLLFRVSTVWLIVAGLVLAAAGFAWMTGLKNGFSIGTFVGATLLLGVGEAVLSMISGVIGRYVSPQHLGKVFGVVYLTFGMNNYIAGAMSSIVSVYEVVAWSSAAIVLTGAALLTVIKILGKSLVGTAKS